MNITKKKIYNLQEGNSSGSGSGGSSFNGNRPMTRNTPGIVGETPGGSDVATVLENVLYPAVAPTASLSIDRLFREIGEDPSYTLTWNAVKNTNLITGIVVDGTTKTPTGATQTGTQTGTFPSATGAYTKSMTVTALTQTGTASASVSYLTRLFFGTTSKSTGITDGDILAITGSELKSSRQKLFTAFGGGSTRLIFAIPTSFGTPQFKINGLNNTAFTKDRSNSDFVNAQGYTVKMDVWISDNSYNSPLDTVEIA